jgi:hypothetical protein
MVEDSSGRLLVGTSSSSADTRALFQATPADGTGFGTILVTRGSSTGLSSGYALGSVAFSDSGHTKAAQIDGYVDGTWTSGSSQPSRLVFSTTASGSASPTERMRITNGGLLKVTTGTQTSRYTNAIDHAIVQDNNNWLVAFNHQNATPNGLIVTYSTDPNNTSSQFLYCQGNTTLRAEIRSNGGLANYSANNVNLSDRNSKKDIALAAGTWDCLKEWEIVNFRYKDQPEDADLNMGVIAQQVAESCPEVITVFQEAKEATETEPAQEERLGVKDQQMMWMAIKALQEAQARIETLESNNASQGASIAALETRLTALEVTP